MYLNQVVSRGARISIALLPKNGWTNRNVRRRLVHGQGSETVGSSKTDPPGMIWLFRLLSASSIVAVGAHVIPTFRESAIPNALKLANSDDDFLMRTGASRIAKEANRGSEHRDKLLANGALKILAKKLSICRQALDECRATGSGCDKIMSVADALIKAFAALETSEDARKWIAENKLLQQDMSLLQQKDGFAVANTDPLTEANEVTTPGRH